MADAASTICARIELTDLGSTAEADRVPFMLPVRVVPGVRYSLVGELRRDGGERLHPGDLRTVERISWEYGRRQPVLLPLIRIN